MRGIESIGSFASTGGHDVTRLYESLPGPLQDEIASESEVFVRDYRAFRDQVTAEINRLHDNHIQRLISPGVGQSDRADDRIAERIESRSYTAFVNANDPVPSEGWFEEALDGMKEVPDVGRGLYYRYAPADDVEMDELPAGLINSGLLLGRFMYEHLFPVPLDDELISDN